MYNNNLTGQRFGKLFVIGYSGENDESGHALWICKCDCGRIKKIRGNHLVSGQVKTCGCERYRGSVGKKKLGVFLKELGYFDNQKGQYILYPETIKNTAALDTFVDNIIDCSLSSKASLAKELFNQFRNVQFSHVMLVSSL